MIPEFFTHQDEWLDQVGRIYAALQSVEVGEAGTGHRVALRRKNRINSIHSSTAIEGNRLSLDQVTAVINGHTVYGPERDILEVQNAWTAYEALETYDPFSVDDFLRAHGLLTSGLIAESGHFRSRDVEIVNQRGEVLHTGSQVAKVPRLVSEMLQWASATKLHPLIGSSATHYLIEHIHPFQDGNGRIGRLWQTLMLSRWNALFAWMPTETLIARHQPDYYTALQASHDPEIDAAPFITFMLGMIEASLRNYQISHQDSHQVSHQDSRQVELGTHGVTILALLAAGPASRAKLLEGIGLKNETRSARRNLAPLIEQGLIEMTNPDNPQARTQQYRLTQFGADILARGANW